MGKQQNPIALSNVWRLKWWPNGPFIFLLEVAEANVASVRGHVHNMKSEPQLEFWQPSSQRILSSNLDDDGKPVAQVERTKTCSTVDKVTEEHIHKKRPFFTGESDDKKEKRGKMKNHYKRTFCGNFGFKEQCWTICTYNKKVPMCLECFHKHVVNVGISAPKLGFWLVFCLFLQYLVDI